MDILQNRESFRENINKVENSKEKFRTQKDTISVKAKRMEKKKKKERRNKQGKLQ